MQLFITREKAARNTEDMTSGLSTEGWTFIYIKYYEVIFVRGMRKRKKKGRRTKGGEEEKEGRMEGEMKED